MLSFLFSLLRTPDAQARDPAAWVGNQAAHALVAGGALLAGLLLATAAGVWLLRDAPAGLALICALYAAVV